MTLTRRHLEHELEKIGFQLVDWYEGEWSAGDAGVGVWNEARFSASLRSNGSHPQVSDEPGRLLRKCQDWAASHDVEVDAFYVDPREAVLRSRIPGGWTLDHATFLIGPVAGSFGATCPSRGATVTADDPDELLRRIEAQDADHGSRASTASVPLGGGSRAVQVGRVAAGPTDDDDFLVAA